MSVLTGFIIFVVGASVGFLIASLFTVSGYRSRCEELEEYCHTSCPARKSKEESHA